MMPRLGREFTFAAARHDLQTGASFNGGGHVAFSCERSSLQLTSICLSTIVFCTQTSLSKAASTSSGLEVQIHITEQG
jgi:hypothetical protein